MALPKSSDAGSTPAFQPETRPAPAPNTYRPGGEVARMHAELSDRLTGAGHPAVASPAESVIRAISVTSGFLLLFLAYGGVALLVWR